MKPGSSEALWLGAITVAAWVLLMSFAFLVQHHAAGTDRATAQVERTMDALRRLPATRRSGH